MRTRQEFSAKVRELAAERSGGRCERCGGILLSGCYHFDHRNPDALGGAPTLENCQVICKGCHGSKTKDDRRDIAKSNRVRRKHFGIKSEPRRWR